jgi:hypothetical protein
MENKSDIPAVKFENSNHVEEVAQSNIETVAGVGSMPCPDTVTDPGGDNTRNKAELVFLDNVLGIMWYARRRLYKYPSTREQIEYWNEIVEAWEDCTGKSLTQGDLEDEEFGRFEEDVS